MCRWNVLYIICNIIDSFLSITRLTFISRGFCAMLQTVLHAIYVAFDLIPLLMDRFHLNLFGWAAMGNVMMIILLLLLLVLL